MDGWTKDINGHDQPGDESTVARATLLWSPSDKFDANLKAQISDFDNNGPFNTAVLLNCKGPNNSPAPLARFGSAGYAPRSEEHTSELQSLMRISYAVFCLKTKNRTQTK